MGVPIEFALATVTRNPAEQLRLAAKGRISVGADADLLVLSADLDVIHVVAGGRTLVRGGHATVRGPFEPA